MRDNKCRVSIIGSTQPKICPHHSKTWNPKPNLSPLSTQENKINLKKKKKKKKMLHLFFAVAFSAAPLIIYIPPIRYLSRFVETIEDLWRETSVHGARVYPRFTYACTRIFNCMLCNN